MMWFLGVDTQKRRGVLTVLWAWAGLLALLIEPAVRLFGVARAGWNETNGQAWAGYLSAILIMVYVEGYRGFHRSFAPAFADRCVELTKRSSTTRCLAAPFVCMGLIGGDAPTRRRMWTLTAFIGAFVVIVRCLPQPYRGMIDAGVAVALICGAVSVTWHLYCALTPRRKPR